MTKFEREEIVRDNRVARLLWFSIGFLCAFALMSALKS